MLNAIFSIKPEYVSRIFSDEKRFEFRTTICKKAIKKIIIYETSPTCKIVGEVSVENILIDTPENIWIQTQKYAGIDHNSYLEYFKGRHTAYAYVLSNPVKYSEPKNLKDYNISAAPQSFIYIDDN